MNDASYDAALLRHSASLPRYTSYPTAPHFTALHEADYRQWLAGLPVDQAVSLYVHVPYCQEMCWFCGCHTSVTKRYEPVRAYAERLMREAGMLREAVQGGLDVRHLHFGGGSPTMLAPDDFCRVMERLRALFTFHPSAELAVEVDPRGVNESKIAAYAAQGINRISMGVQDLEAEVQRAINRVQPFHRVYQAVQWCRDYGITQLSLDLIYGLPHQTEQSMARTVETILALRPDRVSLFGYAHVPWKKKQMRLIHDEDLPDEALRLRLFRQSSRQLQAAGYVAIGLDHFALPQDRLAIAQREGRMRRNFQGYTTDDAPVLLGLGSSAIGSLPEGYVQQHSNSQSYAETVDAGRLPVVRGYRLNHEDRLRRALIEQLMCRMEVDVADVCQDYGYEAAFFEPVLPSLDRLVRDGLAFRDGWNIRVPLEAPQAVRLVAALFDAYVKPSEQRHAKVA